MGSDATATMRAIKTELISLRATEPELLQRLALLDERVRVMIAAQPSPEGGVDHPLRGLYLSHEQATGLATRSAVRCSVGMHISSPLGPQMSSLAARCGLDSVDIDVLVAALAPDVDPRFEKLFGFLHDDMTKRRATIGLAMSLCALEPSDASSRALFEITSPLFANALLVADDDGPFLGRTLRVPDHVVDSLLGKEGLESRLADRAVDAVPVDATEVDDVRSLLQRARLLHLTEGIGGAAAHVAARAAAAAGLRSVIVDVSAAASDELERVAAAVVRHQALTGDVMIVRPADDIAERAPPALARLAAGRGRVVLVGARTWDPAWAAEIPRHLHIGELAQREVGDIWARSLGGATVQPGAIDSVRAAFRLTPEQIGRAARAALFDVDPHGAPLGFDVLSGSARSQSAAGLDRLARRLEPSASWDDLILPDEVTILLRDLSLRVRWREQVMQRWELGRGWRGRGIAALFAGPSGTGKTTAAEVIARDLGYDIHVVDLSSVVDKYIGETEKKLEVIFTEAERTNTVLLFDEADAIFGKRSEVKDARDRYANIEVSYLLQRIERFSGLAILTTNLGANLDEAFTRRLDVVVDFPRPDSAARERLWRHEFRPTVPVDGIDFEFCAEAFDLTGGNIRNIVITAAYLAAESRRPVSMTDVVAAVQREYRKMGRLCLASEFGRYAQLLS